jgi:hypothetical protein
MRLGEDQADCCPHCRKPFEIVHVEFRLNGTAMIGCCPNCAIVSVDVVPAAESQIIEKAKKLAITTRVFWQKVATPMMKSTNDRFRYVLALIIGALATAARCATSFTPTEDFPAKKFARVRYWPFQLLRSQ